ncbi:FUSC family membrane protein [Cnuella takakiae]|nr:FUSC family membrane protein [Cnuella takakiae]OLY93324.1 hypothetical protein BUE76_16605 [Cnuella takakiae]
MKQTTKELRSFFSSQSFSDGLRITISVLLPALIGSFMGNIHMGMLFSLGALCVSLADTPGAIINRTNTMMFCLAFVLATALVTEWARTNLLIMGVLVVVLSFFFSLFLVYGLRGASVGNAALLVMVLSMDQEPLPQGFGAQALFIFCGGLWYGFISLLDYRIAPFRPAQRSLGECIRELADYLRIKANFYDSKHQLEDNFNKLMARQIVVSEKQDAVREVLFKTRQIVKDPSQQGRRLLLAFTDVVDLFEEITATYLDYNYLRREFGHTRILDQIADLARNMAAELDAMGVAIQSNQKFVPRLNPDQAIIQLKADVDALATDKGDVLILKKLLVNIRRMLQRLQDLRLYFESGEPREHKQVLPYDRFVAHQSLDPRLLLDNLNLQSAVFRHSLRVAIAALVGFAVSKFIAQGHHSYWILMTIIFMLKPSFSLTRQRNIERIAGTLAGGVIGIVLLLLIPNKQVLFGLLVLFMLGTYSFMRTRYLLSVIFMTPFILILFSFLGIGFMALLQERVIDTLVGCIIALLAGYILLPNWESEQLSNFLRDMLKANSNYLFRLAEMLSGKTVSITDYKLARKEVYVSSANLSAAFQRMLSEPRRKQVDRSAVQQFVVLNHILFSNTATLASGLIHQPPRPYPAELNRNIRKIINTLCTALAQMNCPCKTEALEALGTTSGDVQTALSRDETLMKEQLEFMYRLSEDIVKAAKKGK